MADLTLAQILALFPDNSTGAIDASDVREALTAIFERTDGTNAIPALQFDTVAPAAAGGPGHLHWDTNEGTLELEVSTEAVLQIGHEQYLNGRNTTGSTILNGRPVRITSGGGQRAFISLDNGLGTVAGIATEDIPNNTTGRVTTFGEVHDVNTSAFNDGDSLYATSTGTLTTTNTSSFVGFVTAAHPSEGVILSRPSRRISGNGTTAQRPTTIAVGFIYFDTTLGHPVFWNGASWVDATGSAA